MKLSKFAPIAGLIVIADIAVAAPPPDNASKNDAKLSDSIVASMSNVDYLGLIIVWNGDGAKTVASCQPQGEQHGTATVKLDSKVLNEGANYVIFVLYNKIEAGFGPFAGGKWSYNFKLKKDGETVWEKSDLSRDSDSAIKYWKVFKMSPDSAGQVDITNELDKAVKKQLQKFIVELEDKLIESADVATPF